MNYEKIYNSLIDRARNRALTGYKERHHIIPKCLGGSNDASNLVDLTPEEHYVAHQLLVKIHPNSLKLSYAAIKMTVSTKYVRRNNKVYGWLKRKHANNISNTQTGRKYYNNGKRCIKLHDGDIIPEGFILGRGWSPTQGTTHSRKNDTFKNKKLQSALANKRWEKEKKIMLDNFGVNTIDEAKKIVLNFKSTCHPRYWRKPTLEKFPFMTSARLRSLIN